MDTARAFLQCGKHERAYLALRAAEEIAPEEITGRPSAHRLRPSSTEPGRESPSRQLSGRGTRWGMHALLPSSH